MNTCKLQKNPYPHQNIGILLNYIEELVLISAKERGLIPIPERQGGYQDLKVLSSKAQSLRIPEEAVSATIMVEADQTIFQKNRAIRFKENGAIPTSNSGFALGDNDIYTIVGKDNLTNFNVIGIEESKTHFLRIQYYKTAQIPPQ